MKIVDWSDLPEELLTMIADRLYSRLELIRFRSICKSWRASPTHKQFPSFSFQVAPLIRPKCHLFFPSDFRARHRLKNNSLSQATLFRIRPSSSSSSKGRLIKLKELESGQMRLLCPLSQLPIDHSCKNLDFLEFQVWELCKVHAITTHEEGRIPSGLKRVVLFPDAVANPEDSLVFTIGWDGKLRYWDYQGEIWVKIDVRNNEYEDLIIHKGQLYVIDRDGIVSWVDPYLNLIQFAPPLGSRSGQKNFVESRGELYIVDRCLAGRTRTGQVVEDYFVSRYGIDRGHYNGVSIYDNQGLQQWTVITRCDSKAVGFKVYKLDEEWGRWEEVKSLGDRAFIMATDCCFSVSANDLDECLENSIYFTDEQDGEKLGSGLNGHDVSVFKLDDGKIENMASSPTHFQLFCPSFL